MCLAISLLLAPCCLAVDKLRVAWARPRQFSTQLPRALYPSGHTDGSPLSLQMTRHNSVDRAVRTNDVLLGCPPDLSPDRFRLQQ